VLVQQCIAKSQGWTFELGQQFAISFGPGWTVPIKLLFGNLYFIFSIKLLLWAGPAMTTLPFGNAKRYAP